VHSGGDRHNRTDFGLRARRTVREKLNLKKNKIADPDLFFFKYVKGPVTIAKRVINSTAGGAASEQRTWLTLMLPPPGFSGMDVEVVVNRGSGSGGSGGSGGKWRRQQRR